MIKRNIFTALYAGVIFGLSLLLHWGLCKWLGEAWATRVTIGLLFLLHQFISLGLSEALNRGNTLEHRVLSLEEKLLLRTQLNGQQYGKSFFRGNPPPVGKPAEHNGAGRSGDGKEGAEPGAGKPGNPSAQ